MKIQQYHSTQFIHVSCCSYTITWTTLRVFPRNNAASLTLSLPCHLLLVQVLTPRRVASSSIGQAASLSILRRRTGIITFCSWKAMTTFQKSILAISSPKDDQCLTLHSQSDTSHHLLFILDNLNCSSGGHTLQNSVKIWGSVPVDLASTCRNS